MKRQILSPEIMDQIEKEDSFEAQSFQQKAANAKPANQNPFEVPAELEESKEEEPEEVELTPREQDKADYEASISKD